ncbi:hypothetical protein ACVWWO_007648 [Bradyrhizobium sp. F1.13.1]
MACLDAGAMRRTWEYHTQLQDQDNARQRGRN